MLVEVADGDGLGDANDLLQSAIDADSNPYGGADRNHGSNDGNGDQFQPCQLVIAVRLDLGLVQITAIHLDAFIKLVGQGLGKRMALPAEKAIAASLLPDAIRSRRCVSPAMNLSEADFSASQ